MAEGLKDLSLGQKILLSVFVGQPLKVDGQLFYNYFDYFLYLWVEKDRETPQQDKMTGIYGELLWRQEILSILEEKYMGVEKGQYKQLAKQFRIDCMKCIVGFSDPVYPDGYDEDFITLDDISGVLTIVARNKIWKDMVMRDQEIVIKQLVNAVSRLNFNEEVEIDSSYIKKNTGYGSVDFLNPLVPMSDAFEQLEKENWGKYVLPRFKHFVDSINLTKFKELLKDPLGDHFLPLGWQGEFLLTHRRFNYIAASRRAGKTFLGAGYLAGRQMMLPMQTIVYIVPTLKNHARPAWRALKNYFGECPEFKFNKSDYSIVNEITKSEMYFITSERGDSVRGNAANLLIIDEAAFVDENIYDTAEALIRTTKGMVYCISTVNPETPKNWFYYKLVDAEIRQLDASSDRFARRVLLTENPFIPDDEKADIIKDGKRNPDKFNAEYMASFMDKDSFNVSNFWNIDEMPVQMMIEGRRETFWKDEALAKDTSNIYMRYLISYDGAKRKDKPGISVRGIKNGGMDLVMCGYMDGYEYRDQVDLIYYIYNMLGGESKCEILMDYGGAGVAVEEIFRKVKKLYPTCIQAVGGLYEENEAGLWKVGKDLMVSKLKTAMNLGAIKGFSFMHELRLEFETYTEDMKRVAGQKNHRDIISSMYHAAWFAERMGFLDKEEIPIEQQRLEGDFAWSTSVDSPLDVIMPSNEFERIEKFGF